MERSETSGTCRGMSIACHIMPVHGHVGKYLWPIVAVATASWAECGTLQLVHACVCVCHKQWSTAVCSRQSAVRSCESRELDCRLVSAIYLCNEHKKSETRVSPCASRYATPPPRTLHPAGWSLPLGLPHCGHVAFITFEIFSDFHLMTQWTDANAAKLIGKTQGQHCVCLMDSYSRAISVLCCLSGPDRC